MLEKMVQHYMDYNFTGTKMTYTPHNFSNLTINYVSAPCGSGKTYSAILNIAEYRKNDKNLFVAPSIELGLQIAKECEKFDIPHICVNSLTIKDKDREKTFFNVKSAIQAAIKQANSCISNGLTIIITTESFKHIDSSWFDKSWTLFVDELPSIDQYIKLEIPYNYEMVSSIIEKGKTLNNFQYQLEISDLKKAEELVYKQTKHDDIHALYKDVVKNILEKNQVIVDMASWDRVVHDDWIDRKETDPDGLYCFHIINLLTPRLFEPFGQVIMLGANFTHSLLYHIWNNYYNVRFIPHKKIMDTLRYKEHPNGHRLTITYLQDDKYSRHQATGVKDGLFDIEHQIKQAEEYFKGKGDVLCALNKADEQFMPKNWTKVPLMSHGLNSFANYLNLFFGAALNRSPKHVKMLKQYGLSDKIIEDSFHNETAYQIACRTSLRDMLATGDVEIMVVDRRVAEYLSRLFINSKIKHISGEHKTIINLDRNDKNKMKKMDLFLENNSLAISYAGEKNICLGEEKDKEECQEAFRKSPDITKCLINLNVYSSIYSTNTKTGEFNPVELFDELRRCHHNNVIHNKSDNDLFNIGKFRDDLRRSVNLEYTFFVVYDIDGGNMSPEKAHDILKKRKVTHIITNSASHGINGVDRYRILIIADRPMNPHVHNLVFDHFVELFEKHHYYTCRNKDGDKFLESCLKYDALAKLSGVDWSKRNGASIFYLPCTVRGREEYAFFYSWGTDARSIKHYAANVEDIIKSSVVDEDDTIPVYKEDLEKAEKEQLKEEKPIERLPNYNKIKQLMSEIRTGNRSSIACVIGGCIKYWNTDKKEEIIRQLKALGCDKSAIQSARKYAKLPY